MPSPSISINSEDAEARIRDHIGSSDPLSVDPDGLLSLGIDLAPAIGLSLDSFALDLFDESPSVARYDAVCLLIGGLWCRGVRRVPIELSTFRRLLNSRAMIELSEQAAGSLLIAIAEGSRLLKDEDNAEIADRVCSLIRGEPLLSEDHRIGEIFARLGIPEQRKSLEEPGLS